MVIEAKLTVAWYTATPCLMMVACGWHMGTSMTGDALCHRQQSEPMVLCVICFHICNLPALSHTISCMHKPDGTALLVHR